MTVRTLLAASALLGGTLVATSAAHAQVGPQYGIGAPDTGAYVNVGVDTLGFDAYGVSGKVGYNFNRWLGVEGQVGTGVIDGEDDLNGVEVDEGYDLFGGAFAVGRVPVTPEIDLFGRVGYYGGQITAEAEGVDAELDVDGLAFGGGVQFNFGPGMLSGIRAEYTNLDVGNVEDLEVNGTDIAIDDAVAEDIGSGDLFSLSYVRRF